MFASKIVRIAAIAAVALVGSTIAAFAATDAYVKPVTANLRSGPGTGYGVVAVLPINTHLTVYGCTPTQWCAAETNGGVEGFIAKSLLKASVGGLPFNFSIIIGPGGGGIVLDDVTEPDDEDEVAEVCFYKGANYTGANFCVEDGDYDDDIPGSFDNNIESILISGGLTVEVCTDDSLDGTCRTYTASKPSLPSSVNNKITSYEVYF